MISGRAPPLTAIAKVFNVLGLVYVTLPVRIALAGFLALRRRWWHLAAFASAIVLSEALIGSLKGIYDRARPPGSLVATTNASFPSGHAIAASVTVVAAVIALVPPGRRRALWGAAAVAFSIVMGLSRAYLAAHWLSDATAGILLGTSCALVTALVADQFQRRQSRLQRAAGTQCLAAGGSTYEIAHGAHSGGQQLAARTWADLGGGDARWVTTSGPWPPGTARPACRRARPSIRTVVSAARPVRRRRCRTLSPSAQQRG